MEALPIVQQPDLQLAGMDALPIVQPSDQLEVLPIDQLPDLCLRHIFAFLSLRDLTRCRAVNRQFKFYADSAKVHELVVDKPRSAEPPYCWYQTDRPVRIEDSISWRAFASLRRSQFALDQQLKFLFIHLEMHRVLNFNFFNGLKQLVHLETKLFDFDYRGRDRYELTLPNLKVLKLPHFTSGQLTLKTPKLEVLYIHPMWKVEFEYPETIKKLESQFLDVSWLTKFQNLEVFRCKSVCGRFAPDLLSRCKHLKELDLGPGLDVDEKWWYFDEFINSLKFVLNQPATLKSAEKLNIYLSDHLLLDASQLDHCEFDRGHVVFKTPEVASD